MKVLVTGATGLIGRVLCKQLAVEGHEVIALVRSRDRARSLIPAPAKLLEVDWEKLEDSVQGQEALLVGVQAVVHLAGESVASKRWNAEVKDSLLKSRVDTLRAVIDLVKRHSGGFPDVFLSASAIGFYGDRAEEVLSEDSSSGNDFLSQLCQAWEAELFQSHLPGVRKVALRLGIVLARGGALEKLIAPLYLRLGAQFGTGNQWVSWIHIDDVVRAISETIKNSSIEGVINCTSPDPVTHSQMIDYISSRAKAFVKLPLP